MPWPLLRGRECIVSQMYLVTAFAVGLVSRNKRTRRESCWGRMFYLIHCASSVTTCPGVRIVRLARLLGRPLSSISASPSKSTPAPPSESEPSSSSARGRFSVGGGAGARIVIAMVGFFLGVKLLRWKGG